MFDHFWKTLSISYPGVAQLVGHLIWVQDAGSSNLPTRTSKSGWFLTKSAVFLICIMLLVSTSGDWPHRYYFSVSDFFEPIYTYYFHSTADSIECFHFRVSFVWPLRNGAFSAVWFLCLLRSIFCVFNRNNTLHRFDQYDRIYVSKVSFLLWGFCYE